MRAITPGRQGGQHQDRPLRAFLPFLPPLLLALSILGAFDAGAAEVVLLGTGFPRPDPLRAGPSTAVVAGGGWFVFDAGRGVTLRIAAANLNYETLRAVFLTHLHSDHTAGLPDLFITSWQFGRKSRPLELYGPRGVTDLSEGMLRFFREDIRLRRDVIEKHPAAGATINPREVREGVVYDANGVRITAFAVDHRPVERAFGYLVEADGRRIVISGDTRPDDNLLEHAKNADVLVIEACLPEHFDRVDTPEVAARLKRYHTTAEEAGQIAAAAGVKRLVLTHLIPANAEETFRERAAKHFTGEILVGKDLLRVRP
ncbi:MAG TPA: MBL fold metallo-hydrolase [Thermoanaerobaculia bacterium]|nr:MBL fold metallo-hydrolase [Thermoanaerobaculia bacterium]